MVSSHTGSKYAAHAGIRITVSISLHLQVVSCNVPVKILARRFPVHIKVLNFKIIVTKPRIPRNIQHGWDFVQVLLNFDNEHLDLKKSFEINHSLFVRKLFLKPGGGEAARFERAFATIRITLISAKMIRWTWNCISDDKISASNCLPIFLTMVPVVFEIGGGFMNPPLHVNG